MIVMDYRDSKLRPVRTGLNIALYPVQLAVDAPFRGLRFVQGFFTDHKKTLEENRKLQTLVNIYSARNQKFHAIAQENIRFRKLLKATDSIKERFMLAEILSVAGDANRRAVTIDKGSDDGVYRGQVVLQGRSIYGQVFSVAPSSAVVLQLIDSKHAIPVRNSRSAIGAIAVGSGNINQLELKNIEANQDIQVGDLFFSSGLGQLFPADFPVATVRTVDYNQGDSFIRVKAQTMTDFSKAREVILIWRSNHLKVLRAADAAAAAEQQN